jgi:FKBP-type peptidyl-prolyl cis-trans isomerase SlyD
MTNPTAVADDVVVEIEYTLTVEGEILDSSEAEGPLAYLHGHDNIVPGLEKELSGKKVGESVSVTVSPEEGYGRYDEEAAAHVPREEIPADVPIEEGVEIIMEDEDGSVMAAMITWVGADEVKLDFNHPLAGRELGFEVKVVGLREPTEEEMEHGHAHMDGHEH